MAWQVWVDINIYYDLDHNWYNLDERILYKILKCHLDESIAIIGDVRCLCVRPDGGCFDHINVGRLIVNMIHVCNMIIQ